METRSSLVEAMRLDLAADPIGKSTDEDTHPEYKQYSDIWTDVRKRRSALYGLKDPTTPIFSPKRPGYNFKTALKDVWNASPKPSLSSVDSRFGTDPTVRDYTSNWNNAWETVDTQEEVIDFLASAGHMLLQILRAIGIPDSDISNIADLVVTARRAKLGDDDSVLLLDAVGDQIIPLLKAVRELIQGSYIENNISPLLYGDPLSGDLNSLWSDIKGAAAKVDEALGMTDANLSKAAQAIQTPWNKFSDAAHSLKSSADKGIDKLNEGINKGLVSTIGPEATKGVNNVGNWMGYITGMDLLDPTLKVTRDDTSAYIDALAAQTNKEMGFTSPTADLTMEERANLIGKAQDFIGKTTTPLLPYATAKPSTANSTVTIPPDPAQGNTAQGSSAVQIDQEAKTETTNSIEGQVPVIASPVHRNAPTAEGEVIEAYSLLPEIYEAISQLVGDYTADKDMPNRYLDSIRSIGDTITRSSAIFPYPITDAGEPVDIKTQTGFYPGGKRDAAVAAIITGNKLFNRFASELEALRVLQGLPYSLTQIAWMIVWTIVRLETAWRYGADFRTVGSNAVGPFQFMPKTKLAMNEALSKDPDAGDANTWALNNAENVESRLYLQEFNRAFEYLFEALATILHKGIPADLIRDWNGKSMIFPVVESFTRYWHLGNLNPPLAQKNYSKSTLARIIKEDGTRRIVLRAIKTDAQGNPIQWVV